MHINKYKYILLYKIYINIYYYIKKIVHTRRDEASYSQCLVLVCVTEWSTSDWHSLLLSRVTRCDFVSFLHFIFSLSKRSTRGWFNQRDREHKQIFKTSAQPQSEGCNRLKPFSIKNTTVQCLELPPTGRKIPLASARVLGQGQNRCTPDARW